MKVEVLVRLKVGPREIIPAGTIFNAPIEEFPPWLVAAIERKSKNIKVHAEPVKPEKKALEPAPESAKKKRGPKPKIIVPKEKPVKQKKESSSLRKKFEKME